jgi:diguanylate cyclase (GGDEF)-like protein
MTASSGAKPSNLIGGVSARPPRARLVVKDHPPAVRQGLSQLMQEVEAARAEPVHMRRAAGEENRDAAASHRPCLDRSAFVRELGRIASFVERYAVPAGVIYMQVDKLDAITERNGPEAAAAALARVAETLASQVRDTDFVGELGGGDFGVILAKATQAEANAKAEMLGELIKASPIVRDGRAIQLSVTAGAQALSA